MLHFEVTVNGDVVDKGSKHFKGVWSQKKLKWILLTVEAMIERYGPDKVELKVPHPGRRSEGLDKLIDQISKITYNNDHQNTEAMEVTFNLKYGTKNADAQ